MGQMTLPPGPGFPRVQADVFPFLVLGNDPMGMDILALFVKVNPLEPHDHRGPLVMLVFPWHREFVSIYGARPFERIIDDPYRHVTLGDVVTQGNQCSSAISPDHMGPAHDVGLIDLPVFLNEHVFVSGWRTAL